MLLGQEGIWAEQQPWQKLFKKLFSMDLGNKEKNEHLQAYVFIYFLMRNLFLNSRLLAGQVALIISLKP